MPATKSKNRLLRLLSRRATIAVLLLLVAALLAANILTGRSFRPDPPTPGVKVSLPFGAIDINELNLGDESRLQKSLEKALRNPGPWRTALKNDGTPVVDILVLTGGGSRGAYGAGILCGWTVAGSRPDFRVVTGVSTGALQSTFAFLGP